MIEDPDAFIPSFAAAGADMIAVHVEVCRHLNRTLQLIADHGMKPAVVLNPATPVEALFEVLPMVHHVLVMSVNPGFGGQSFLPRSIDRIAHLARLRSELGLEFRIEVDGGIAQNTVASVVHAGADMLVAGSAIFSPRDGAPHKTEENARAFLKTARAAISQTRH
jgi:ribulose-phosphate 3-epimerase